MTVYRPAPADEIPTVYLERWKAYRVKSKSPLLQGTTHMVGYNIDAGDGRVSSPIVKWRPAQKQVVTRSGRVYQLQGEPGVSSDALYVWGIWCRKNGIIGIEDVTAEFVRKGQKPGPKPQKKRPPKRRPKKGVLTSTASTVD